MSSIKYTDDGKKVLVVGKLNAEQTIVQEIFISAGQEIPSGENFVVKSLHDQPAESWKEKHLRELEARFEKQKEILTRDIDQQSARLTLAKEKAKLHADAISRFINCADESQLQILKSFMAGEITHLFISGYSPEIIDWMESNNAYDVESSGYKIMAEGIKLVSLMGRSDGDLSYRIHDYRDGSGGSKQVYPACGYEEALHMAQEELNKQCVMYLDGRMRSIDLAKWEAIAGIVVPDSVRKKYDAEAAEAKQKRIETLRAQLAELEA